MHPSFRPVTPPAPEVIKPPQPTERPIPPIVGPVARGRTPEGTSPARPRSTEGLIRPLRTPLGQDDRQSLNPAAVVMSHGDAVIRPPQPETPDQQPVMHNGQQPESAPYTNGAPDSTHHSRSRDPQDPTANGSTPFWAEQTVVDGTEAHPQTDPTATPPETQTTTTETHQTPADGYDADPGNATAPGDNDSQQHYEDPGTTDTSLGQDPLRTGNEQTSTGSTSSPSGSMPSGDFKVEYYPDDTEVVDPGRIDKAAAALGSALVITLESLFTTPDDAQEATNNTVAIKDKEQYTQSVAQGDEAAFFAERVTTQEAAAEPAPQQAEPIPQQPETTVTADPEPTTPQQPETKITVESEPDVPPPVSSQDTQTSSPADKTETTSNRPSQPESHETTPDSTNNQTTAAQATTLPQTAAPSSERVQPTTDDTPATPDSAETERSTTDYYDHAGSDSYATTGSDTYDHNDQTATAHNAFSGETIEGEVIEGEVVPDRVPLSAGSIALGAVTESPSGQPAAYEQGPIRAEGTLGDIPEYTHDAGGTSQSQGSEMGSGASDGSNETGATGDSDDEADEIGDFYNTTGGGVRLTGINGTKANQAPQPRPVATAATAQPRATGHDADATHGHETAQEFAPEQTTSQPQPEQTTAPEPEERLAISASTPRLLRRRPRTSRTAREKFLRRARKGASVAGRATGASAILMKRLAFNAPMAARRANAGVQVTVERAKGFIRGRLKRVIVTNYSDGRRPIRKEVFVVGAQTRATLKAATARALAGVKAVEDALLK